MKLLDRYTSKLVDLNNLPDEIDFGRYLISEEGKIGQELTYSNCPIKNKVIHQEILLDENKSLQDIFLDILVDIQKAPNNAFDVIPLIRQISNKFGLNDFEILLFDKIFHIQEIFRHPHYLLDRVIEKVNVSRAKRIPSKSYQYLASHTEDWVHKSIVSFKPSRILHEELEHKFDLYENQLTVGLVERCLIYLNSRLNEIQNIKDFLNQYEKLLKDKDFGKGWYRKIERNLNLIGEVYSDENYKGSNKAGKVLSKTEETLVQLKKRLQLLRNAELYSQVNKRATQSVVLHNTNVLVNHKHYRYIKNLWVELEKVRPELTEQKKLDWEQNVLLGIRAYVKSALAYVFKQYFKYELLGNYEYFIAKHRFHPDIELKENENGVLYVTIDEISFSLVMVANPPKIDSSTNDIIKKKKTYLMTLSDNTEPQQNLTINISPLDADSIERIAILIKKYLLKLYFNKISQPYSFRHLLRDFIDCIPSNFIEFDKTNFQYHFTYYPNIEIKSDKVIENLEKSLTFIAIKSRPDRDKVIHEMNTLIDEINIRANELKEKYLVCFNCSEKLQAFNIIELNYLHCKNCNCLVDASQPKMIQMRINDLKYSHLTPIEFGMDNINVSTNEL